jgi:hypothetical protein
VPPQGPRRAVLAVQRAAVAHAHRGHHHGSRAVGWRHRARWYLWWLLLLLLLCAAPLLQLEEAPIEFKHPLHVR